MGDVFTAFIALLGKKHFAPPTLMKGDNVGNSTNTHRNNAQALIVFREDPEERGVTQVLFAAVREHLGFHANVEPVDLKLEPVYTGALRVRKTVEVDFLPVFLHERCQWRFRHLIADHRRARRKGPALSNRIWVYRVRSEDGSILIYEAGQRPAEDLERDIQRVADRRRATSQQ